MSKSVNYIGDTAFSRFLDKYDCPVPLYVIKARILGAIASPNIALNNIAVITSFWPANEDPRPETKEEAEEFFNNFFGLWSRMEKLVSKNGPFLTKLKLAKDVDQLRDNLNLRIAELEGGFIEGFWGGMDDLKMSAIQAETIDRLSDLVVYWVDLVSKLEEKEISVEDAGAKLADTGLAADNVISSLLHLAVEAKKNA